MFNYLKRLNYLNLLASYRDWETFEEINEQIEKVSSDAFIKDIHSLGFWYLNDLGEYITQNLSSYITQEALDELEEAYVFEEKRINKDKFLLTPQIYHAKNYQEINPANVKEFISFHKDKNGSIFAYEAKPYTNRHIDLDTDEWAALS